MLLPVVADVSLRYLKFCPRLEKIAPTDVGGYID